VTFFGVPATILERGPVTARDNFGKIARDTGRFKSSTYYSEVFFEVP